MRTPPTTSRGRERQEGKGAREATTRKRNRKEIVHVLIPRDSAFSLCRITKERDRDTLHCSSLYKEGRERRETIHILLQSLCILQIHFHGNQGISLFTIEDVLQRINEGKRSNCSVLFALLTAVVDHGGSSFSWFLSSCRTFSYKD